MKKKIVWASLCLVIVVLALARHSVLGSPAQPDVSLLGSDSNKNGIRDDIDDYILKRFPKSDTKRAALSQMAKDYQSAFSVYDDPEKLKAATGTLDKTLWCVGAVFNDPATATIEGNSLIAEIFNNKKRSLVGIHIEALLSEIPFNLPPHEEQLKECRFDSSKMKN